MLLRQNLQSHPGPFPSSFPRPQPVSRQIIIWFQIIIRICPLLPTTSPWLSRRHLSADYCKSLLTGLPASSRLILQFIFYTTSRVSLHIVPLHKPFCPLPPATQATPPYSHPHGWPALLRLDWNKWILCSGPLHRFVLLPGMFLAQTHMPHPFKYLLKYSPLRGYRTKSFP